MRRKLFRFLVLLLAGTGLAGQIALAAEEPEILEVSDAEIAAMDVDRAMDLVSEKMGYYWLRSLRWTCVFEMPGGENGVNHYGVRLTNLAGLTLQNDDAGAFIGTIFFNYAPVPNALCRIPYRVASRQEALDLTAAFRRLSREPRDTLRARIEARYGFNATAATSIDRFMTTESSFEILKVQLQDFIRSQVRAGGAGEFVAEPPAIGAGSEYAMSAIYGSDFDAPDVTIDSEVRLLAAGRGDYEVQRKRAGRVEMCRDSSLFRAMTLEGVRECRGESNSVRTTSFRAIDGQVSYLPTNINTTSYYEADAEEVLALASGRSVASRSRYVRACYAEALETIVLPAGSFDTVRFLCGSVRSKTISHDKESGSVWVDRKNGLPVKSELQGSSVYRSQRYRLNETMIRLNTAP